MSDKSTHQALQSDVGETERIYAYVSPKLKRRGEQIKQNKGHRSVSATVNIALRAYIDEQEDQIGSRRHFQQTMQRRLDRLENTVQYHLALQTVLTAMLSTRSVRDLARIMNLIEGRSADEIDEGADLKPSEAIAAASKVTVEQYQTLMLQIQEALRTLYTKEKSKG